MTLLVGKQAPDFTVPAIMDDNVMDDNFNFREYIKDSIGILFFWPFDFSYVCPSEVIAFNNRFDKFAERGAKIVGCSVDSHYTHYTWKNTPVNEGGIGKVRFPLASDIGGVVSEGYGVLAKNKVAYRSTFIINKKGVVIHQSINDFTIGRNVDETLRLVDALLYIKAHGGNCPVNWKKGDSGVESTQESVKKFLSENSEKL